MMPWLLAQGGPPAAAKALARQAAAAQADLPAASLWPLIIGLCGVAAALAVWLAAAWYRARRQPRAFGRPWRLFFQLAQAHRLAWRDVWLLYRLARHLKLRQPALLFVQPENFGPRRLEGWRAGRIARLDQLRQRLFEGLDQRQTPGDEEHNP